MRKLLTVAAVLVLSACAAKENAESGTKADSAVDTSHVVADSVAKPVPVLAIDTAAASKK